MPSAPHHILIILTSNSVLQGYEGHTGFYYEELATPYYVFTDSGLAVDIASIQGGLPPHDPDSLAPDSNQRPPSVQRSLHDKTAMAQLQHSMPIHQAAADDYDAIFLAGGHGAMDDFSANGDLARLISSLYAAGGIISAVCHGTAGLLSAQKNDGSPLVKGLHVSSFTNEEERKTPKGAYLPFLLETRLREEGAIFESSVPFEACIVQDRRLVTGQNAASAQNVAENVVELLKILPQEQQNHNAA